MDRHTHFEKKTYERLTGRTIDDQKKPEYFDEAEPFTGNDDYDVLLEHTEVGYESVRRRKKRDPDEEAMLPGSEEERKAEEKRKLRLPLRGGPKKIAYR